MNTEHIVKIAEELSLLFKQVEGTSKLLEDGATVPFIARYRKEATGSLDEVAITYIRDRLAQLEELDKRKEGILKSLDERGILTDELKEKITRAPTLTVLEDIYLPFRPKKKTRASIARSKGLEPLAKLIFDQKGINPYDEAEKFIDPEKDINSVHDAMQGARDIIAEWINESQGARAKIRELFLTKGEIITKVVRNKEKEGIKYRDYYDYLEPLSKAPSHRILAVMRGEKEGFLSLKVLPPEESAILILEKMFLKNSSNDDRDEVKTAIYDSYKRLLSSSMETQIRSHIKKRADEESIGVFKMSLKELLLAPPFGQKRLIAIDPGIRTGCKVVCLDSQGQLLQTATIFISQSKDSLQQGGKIIRKLCDKFNIEAIAIGNGTGGKETETFIRSLGLDSNIQIVMVNESGASVYSASEVGRQEFPDHDVTVRGAVSIGRRLMDPLAELVKIDPKSIGVGQYQHDVDQKALKEGLDDVVISSTNAVGVDVNTASKELLTYVSGLGKQLASNIVSYRNENGPFKSRASLKKVPKLGPKAFEQSAGFLRINDGKNPLDKSAVHPESYRIVETIAKDLSCPIADLLNNEKAVSSIDFTRYVSDTVGLPTLEDIKSELLKPGRDPRDKFEAFSFKEGIDKVEDVTVGMVLPGIVTNITSFGAFVDIGVHQDGLVHISQLADHFVKEPKNVVKIHQKVNVTVIDVDLQRRRVSLSMKKNFKA